MERMVLRKTGRKRYERFRPVKEYKVFFKPVGFRGICTGNVIVQVLFGSVQKMRGFDSAVIGTGGTGRSTRKIGFQRQIGVGAVAERKIFSPVFSGQRNKFFQGPLPMLSFKVLSTVWHCSGCGNHARTVDTGSFYSHESTFRAIDNTCKETFTHLLKRKMLFQDFELFFTDTLHFKQILMPLDASSFRGPEGDKAFCHDRSDSWNLLELLFGCPVERERSVKNLSVRAGCFFSFAGRFLTLPCHAWRLVGTGHRFRHAP